MTKAIWMSYDLGVTGDYEGLYSWLDDRGAKECGDSVAFFRFSCSGPLIESLTAELSDAVSLNKKSRIYVVYKDDEERVRGRFIVGRRKRAPWEGFGADEEQEEDEADVAAS